MISTKDAKGGKEKKDTGADKDLFLGIDLGTSRTAMMSNRGAKSLFKSVVGYPKDIIAANLLNDTLFVGEEALDNASSLDLFMPLEHGMIKEDATDQELGAVRAILQRALEQSDPQPDDRKCAIIGVPAQASVQNIDFLLDLANDIFDVTLVVSEPFLVAYSINRLVNSIVIDIGAGTTDMCILHGSLPGLKDQITSFRAGDYLDSSLENQIALNNPNIQFTRNMVRKIKEQFSFVGDVHKEVEVRFRRNGKPVQVNVAREIRAVCEDLVPEIIEHVEKLIIDCDPERQEEVLQNIFLAGGGSQIAGLAQMIEDELAGFGTVKVTAIDSPDYAGCDGALKIATDFAPENWHEIGPVRSK